MSALTTSSALMMIITLQRPLPDEACVCFKLSRTMVRTFVGHLHLSSTPAFVEDHARPQTSHHFRTIETQRLGAQLLAPEESVHTSLSTQLFPFRRRDTHETVTVAGSTEPLSEP